MAITVKTSATIRGKTYNQGNSFVCAAAVKGNGGSEGNASSAKALTVGQTYYFLGYAVAADSGSTVTYPYRVGSSSSTSSAIGWYTEAVFPYGTYTVSFNANGGSGAPSAQTKTHGTTLTLSSTKPTRTGYTFKNWNTNSSGTGTSYNSGASYTANAAVTLYAQWTANTYTVSYNANGGSGAPGNQTKTYGVNLTLSSTKPTRDGYNFLGWATSSSATTATYSAGSTYTANSSVTLYAVWTQSSTVQTIMARYQNTDGSWGSYGTVYSAVLNSGDTCSWSQAETDEFKSASVSYTVSGATTKYVDVYRKQYTVSFNSNGGVWTPPTITYYYGSDLYLKKRPTRSGYTFLGWSTSSTATEADYTTDVLFNTTIASNINLYAIWSKNSNTSSNINTINNFGSNGEIYTSSIIEETLDNGDFAIGSDFIAVSLYEGKYDRYYLTDNDGNQLTDNDGSYLYGFIEEAQDVITTTAIWDVELLTSDEKVLKDSNGLTLIAGRNE